MKTCSKCGLDKPLEEYYNKGTKKNSWCKRCDREIRRATQARWTKENELLIEERRRAGCIVCGITNPLVLQFHHHEPIGQGGNQQGKKGRAKYARIGTVKLNASPMILKKHLDRCHVLCANCHLLVHAGEVTLTPPITKAIMI